MFNAQHPRERYAELGKEMAAIANRARAALESGNTGDAAAG